MLDATGRSKVLLQVVRFGLTGITATVTHFLMLILFTGVAGLRPWLANGSAFCVALLITWVGQKSWVFESENTSSDKFTAVRFLIVALTGLAANSSIMFACEQFLEDPIVVGFLIATTTVPVLTFILSKFWVFRAQISFTGECK
jgi:putative flippase GtrA